jgi:hypothetical protein
MRLYSVKYGEPLLQVKIVFKYVTTKAESKVGFNCFYQWFYRSWLNSLWKSVRGVLQCTLLLHDSYNITTEWFIRYYVLIQVNKNHLRY